MFYALVAGGVVECAIVHAPGANGR